MQSVFRFIPEMFNEVEALCRTFISEIMSSWRSLYIHGHCDAGTGIGILVPVKRSCISTAYTDILYTCVLMTLWMQFEKKPVMVVVVRSSHIFA